MTSPATVYDDDELPALTPLDTDDGAVDVPDELKPDMWEGSLDGDDTDDGVDTGVIVMTMFGDDDEGGDEGSPDDPIDALPDDERGRWVGDEERVSGDDDGAEIADLPRDEPDTGEDGPMREPYDEVDTALPALDDDEGEDGPVEPPSP